MKRPFLSAQWKKLIMANYEVDPQWLSAYLPAGTELDFWNDHCYVSLVGFEFTDTRLHGIHIPFHVRFPEVNLRFYVRHLEEGKWKRGVVFIREIVPRQAIVWVANSLFHERYRRLPMKSETALKDGRLHVKYAWNYKGCWNQLSVEANAQSEPIKAGSEEEFLTEHYWGYAAGAGQLAVRYAVEHPRWQVHHIVQYRVECDFGRLYGESFGQLAQCPPQSILLAEGSPVKVFPREQLQ